MIINPSVLAYFPTPYSPVSTMQAPIEKTVNNIVATHGFLPQGEPEDTLWLLY